MIHILFGASASGSLKFALREMGLEWLSLAESHETLRILHNGRIQSVPEHYYMNLLYTRPKSYMVNERQRIL